MPPDTNQTACRPNSGDSMIGVRDLGLRLKSTRANTIAG